MLKVLKKILRPEAPSVIAEAERELRDAERDFLAVATKVDYYVSLAECHASRIHRLREVLKTGDVLAEPDLDKEYEATLKGKLH